MAKKKLSKQAISSIIGDLTFSDAEVYVWVKITPSQYEFQDYKSREKLARDLDLAVSNLLSSDERALECHLIVSSKPFDSNEWANNLTTRSLRNSPNQENTQFLKDMHNYVDAWKFREKVVYLGVNLGNRKEFSQAKSIIPLGPFTNVINSFIGVVDQYVSEKELKFWNVKAKAVRSSLYSSRVKGKEVFAEDLAYIIRKNFFPAMQAPTAKDLIWGEAEVWGEGEIGALVDAEIENGPRFLKMTQLINGVEQSGYRATLCFSKFPEVMAYPERSPWIHFASLLGFSTDIYSRFSLEPSRKVRKEVDRKLKEVQDQARNQTSAGGNVSLQVQENLNLGTELDFALSKDNTPWVFGRHRIIVEAPTEELLKERAQGIIDHYKGLDIFVVWPTGDQMSLLMEGLPSDKVRVASYYQRQELSIISAGVPAGSGTVGDSIIRRPDGKELGWMGPYLGHTTGTTVEPVFFSVHSSIARNNPPGVAITGSPGGGKSFTAFTLTYQMALAGIWTIYIDPKADALPMVNLPGMNTGTTRLIDLKDGNDGILDPFSIGNNASEQKELALETIGLFLGGQKAMTPKERSELSKTIQIVASQPQPSLNKIVDMLLASTNDEAESLGQTLNFIRELPFARLCFAPKTQDTLRADQGLTIITLLGLDLPNSSATVDTYTNSNRLAVAVMFLLTSFTRQLMLSLDKSHPKAIVIDEAWAITSTPQGKKLVFEVARMGRSLNTGLILVSQNAGDFLGEGVTNSVSTKLAFRATNVDEIDNVLRFFDLELHDGNRDVIRELKNGECLIRDADGRIARVQVDGWNQKMNYAFETNPETRKAN